jgi:hypothetical protein
VFAGFFLSALSDSNSLFNAVSISSSSKSLSWACGAAEAQAASTLACKMINGILKKSEYLIHVQASHHRERCGSHQIGAQDISALIRFESFKCCIMRSWNYERLGTTLHCAPTTYG